MPAEWERHEASWLSWPKDPGTFSPEILPAVESAYVEMVEALSESEEVRILVDDERTESRVSSMLGHSDQVSFQRIKTVDVWVRDYGPTYISGKATALVKWIFNSWGNKYEGLKADDAAGERIAASSGLPVFRPGVVMEGGSFDVNGLGTLLTTEQCLLNPNRNPNLDRASLETVLRRNLGVRTVIWLRAGIEGDDTDGHVDDVARFVGPAKVVVAAEENRNDANHSTLRDCLRILENARDQDGRALEVTTIPMPGRLNSTGGRLPASHLNFYVGNSCVLVPTFGGKSDREALDVLSGAFSDREAVGIDCRALVHGLGTIHCVTQQVPASGVIGTWPSLSSSRR